MKPKITIPTDDEDREITRAATADPDNQPLTDAFFETARRGRPNIPETDRKRRINLMLDPEVIDRLKATGNMSARVNRLLRKELGLQ